MLPFFYTFSILFQEDSNNFCIKYLIHPTKYVNHVLDTHNVNKLDYQVITCELISLGVPTKQI